jgi:hypothetical protein
MVNDSTSINKTNNKSVNINIPLLMGLEIQILALDNHQIVAL